MEQDLVKQELGSEGEMLLKLEGGKLVLSVTHSSPGGSGKIEYAVDSSYFLDKLAALIPGQVDDAVIQILKAALKV